MSHLADKTIAVVGGGIGGLTAALAFARHGAKVFVYEQAAEIAEVGAGLQLTPNGARALAALGMQHAVMALNEERGALGLVANAVQPMDGVSGRAVARFDLTRQDPRYRFVHRSELITRLLSQCLDAGATLKTNSRVDGDLPQADLVVGADGVKSVLRPMLNGSAEPRFTGQVAWRAMISAEHPPEARIWMLPGRHVVTYPLSHGRVNIVAVQERAEWAEEGWHQPDAPANLQAAFRDASAELQAILAAVETTHLWGLFLHDVAPIWHNEEMVLLGDAAHPTLPFLAQGANLAIEDAYVLVRRLSENWDTGLATYVAERKPRVTRAIAAANANARNYHLKGLQRRAAHLALGGLGAIAPDAFLNRMSWLYGFDVTA